MAGGGRDHLVPPSSQVQAPCVGVNPHPPVSRSPPCPRLHRLLRVRPACSLPAHVSTHVFHHFSPSHPVVLQAAILRERPRSCGPPRCRPTPGPSRALARAADPLRAAHRGGMLAPAAGAAAAPVATARAAFTAPRVVAFAGLFLSELRAQGGPAAPPPPPRRPPTVARRAPVHQTHSPPLFHHAHPPFK